ncbi:MAG: DUF262 domain-containing protein [Magnetococcales bacterium]|nr:DUF262 domain-containing protein [Magnetococcales bacterium]MBF0631810.1 DUF262 domain-containing protein [Magnetococcales bacterium]
MAKTILLETRTATLLDLLGNGKVYRVPPFQRDYSWKDEQWEDLWNDIIDIHGRAEAYHYMGALVLEGQTDREFLIIDGQQRLATLSLLALAVLDRLKNLVEAGVEPEQNKERSIGLRNRFIGEKDPASLVESSKLFLNETDNGFYQDYLVQGRKPVNMRRMPHSNGSLWNCFQFFIKCIDRLPELNRDGMKLAQLLHETVARQLQFILISVDDELNAYTVFETLNARGLELSATDLLKNYLFSRIKAKGDLESLQRRWNTLISIVRQEKFPEFLRYHLLCQHGKVRKQRLFKMVRDTVRTPREVFELLDKLEERAEIFSAVMDPQHEFWSDRPECRPRIKELSLFRVQQMMPLLFAAWERCDRDEFHSILRMVSVISFRFTIVSGLNPNELEHAYHKAAKSLLDGGSKTPEAIFGWLNSIYVQDEKFMQDFSSLSLSGKGQQHKLVKYILVKLENQLSGGSLDHETDPGTIEHILPENPLEEWDVMFPESEWDASRYRLGNMTLLQAKDNRQIGNGDYGRKVNLYQKSGYILSSQLAEFAPEVWTPALLEKRQKELARVAVRQWRLSYGN